MANYLKKQNRKQQNSDSGRVSLWTADDDAKYLLSGTIQIDGQEYRVFIYENVQKKSENSPDYFGYVVEPKS